MAKGEVQAAKKKYGWQRGGGGGETALDKTIQQSSKYRGLARATNGDPTKSKKSQSGNVLVKGKKKD